MNDEPCRHTALRYSPIPDAVICLDCFKTWLEEPEPCMLNHVPYCALPHYPPQPWPYIVTNDRRAVNPLPNYDNPRYPLQRTYC